MLGCSTETKVDTSCSSFRVQLLYAFHFPMSPCALKEYVSKLFHMLINKTSAFPTVTFLHVSLGHSLTTTFICQSFGSVNSSFSVYLYLLLPLKSHCDLADIITTITSRLRHMEDLIVTPFAQILASLRSVRSNLYNLTNVTPPK